jgi:methylated-DNA-protein-cysteine methyltransferase-like protein
MDVPFFQQVYEVTRSIPLGRVTTYGAISDYLGQGSARMVGWALNKCSGQAMDVPAHRVVNRNGELTGRNHFPSPGLMQELLLNEGVRVKDDRIVDFDRHFWHPGQME